MIRNIHIARDSAIAILAAVALFGILFAPLPAGSSSPALPELVWQECDYLNAVVATEGGTFREMAKLSELRGRELRQARRSLLYKLQARNHLEVVIVAIKLGIVDPLNPVFGERPPGVSCA